MRDASGWINTFSGRQFWPLDPDPRDIFIEDIAHALSLQCRFTGHVRQFYSVAQHCCEVADHAALGDELWGLLHDASEAYLVDVAKPLKRSATMDGYRDAEARLMRVICAWFHLDERQPISVTEADQRMLATEARDLMTRHKEWLRDCPFEPYPEPVRPMTPGAAERAFLKAFRVYDRGQVRRKRA